MIVNAFYRVDMLDGMDPIKREHRHVQNHTPSSLSGMQETNELYLHRTDPMYFLQE
jgi:hypothetical protein